MTYEEWLEESKINEIPEQYREEFKLATKASWEASIHYAENAEREACAKVSEASALKLGDLGREHEKNSNATAMCNCYTRSLQCTQVASEIRTRIKVHNAKDIDMIDTNIYVVVAENNIPHESWGERLIDDGGPLIFEQYVKTASFENAKKKAANLSLRFGKCRIAKIEFIDA